MTKKDKKVERTIRLKVLEIVKKGVNIDKPHHVDYHTNYECYVETEDGKSNPKDFSSQDRLPVIDFLDILANAIASTILDELDNPPTALKLAQALAQKIVGVVAEGLDVTVVRSLDDLRDKFMAAGAPPHVVAQATEDVKEQIRESEEEQQAKLRDYPRHHPAMDGLETAQLTREQEASLALTLASSTYLKSGKN